MPQFQKVRFAHASLASFRCEHSIDTEARSFVPSERMGFAATPGAEQLSEDICIEQDASL
jgi:hypothetical protein